MKSKLILCILFACLLSFNLLKTQSVANAKTQDNSQLATYDQDITTNDISITEENGDKIFFESEEDKQMYLNDQNNNIQPRAVGLSQKVKTISSTRYNMRFSGYSNMTPSWTKASKYTIQAGRSLNFSTGAQYKGLNLTLGFARTYGVTTTIKANPKRYSRLAGYQDVTLTKKQRIYYQAGKKIRTVNFVTQKTHAKYVKVKYK